MKLDEKIIFGDWVDLSYICYPMQCSCCGGECLHVGTLRSSDLQIKEICCNCWYKNFYYVEPCGWCKKKTLQKRGNDK